MNQCWKYLALIFLASCQCDDKSSSETVIPAIQNSLEEKSSSDEIAIDSPANDTLPSLIKKEQAKEALAQYFQTANYPQSPTEYRACVINTGCQAILKQTVEISRSAQSSNNYIIKPIEKGNTQAHFSCFFGRAPDEVKNHEIFIPMIVDGDFHAGWLCASEQINFESNSEISANIEPSATDPNVFEPKTITLARGKFKRDYLIQADHCPENFSAANLKNPQDFKDILCKSIRTFDVLKIGEHSTISGLGYFCAIVEKDASSPNLNLCVDEKLDLLQQKSKNLGKIGKKQFLVSTDFDGCDAGFRPALKTDFDKKDIHKKICGILTELNISISFKDKSNLKGVDGQCLPTKDPSNSILCIEK